MSHDRIIIQSTPPATEGSTTSTMHTSIEFVPADNLTPDQIGAEVSRLFKLIRRMENP